MTVNTQEIITKSDIALFKDLERRYGPAMAQEIIDQLKKAESGKKGQKPADYFSVKALSEAGELYRGEAQAALKRLKARKADKQKTQDDVVELESVFLKRDFQKLYAFYMRFHRGYYILYRQAMEAYKISAYTPYKEVRSNDVEQTTTKSKAA